MESSGNGELNDALRMIKEVIDDPSREVFADRPLTPHEAELAARLADFESVGRRLWPFVRYFGLMGGDASAIEAVADLGRLLGFAGQPADIDTITRRAKVQAFEELACWLEHSPWLKRMAPDARKPFVEAVRGLAESS